MCASLPRVLADLHNSRLIIPGASECVLMLMQQVLSLLKLAVSQPDEVIARVGCSCFRYVYSFACSRV
jgi:hypothetical protein